MPAFRSFLIQSSQGKQAFKPHVTAVAVSFRSPGPKLYINLISRLHSGSSPRYPYHSLTMATMEHITYIPVPPPPLPEFYLPKQQRHHKKSSSSSASDADVVEKSVIKETVTSTDGAYDGRPGLGSIPTRHFITVPPPRHGNDIPPLAVYHICRICLRTRSPRYHREHPIPIDGMPPPPGICRRCRVTSMEKIKEVAEIVVQSESNPIKLGCITPFVPDDDIVRNEEMRKMKLERYLRDTPNERCMSRHRSRSRKDIVFRHVRVVDESFGDASEDEETGEEVIEEVVVPRKRQVVFTTQDTIGSTPVLGAPAEPKVATTSMQVEPTTKAPSVFSRSVKVEALRKMDSAKASVSTQASSSSTKSGSASTVRASAKASVHSRPGYAESDIRKIARDEIEQYAKAMQEPKQRDAEIRRLAREEVERYRQAERKLEAHPQGFARGRLVPVERRIDIERDSAEPTPWMPPVRKEESVTKFSSKSKSNPATARRDSAYESVPEIAKLDPSATANSWGATWRRETSIERHSRREAGPADPQPREDRITTEKKTQSGTSKAESNKPASGKLHKIYDEVQDSDPPKWSSKAEPYVVEVRRQQPQDRHNIIEVTEEIDLPPRSRTASYRRPQYGDSKPARPQAPVPERIRELRADPGREGNSKQNLASPQRTDREQDDNGSDSNKRNFWYDETTVRTSNSKSTTQYASSNKGGPRQEAQIPFPSPMTERAAPASTHSRVTFQADQNSDRTRWPKEQSVNEEHRSSRASFSSRLPYPEDNLMPDRSEQSADPGKKQTSRTKSSKQESSAQVPNSEYMYIERTVQPADRRRGSRPFDDAPPEERVEMEETLVVRRRREAEAPSRPRHRDRDMKHVRESDESNHVKFNSKVEISPTPPGSDASSSEWRSFHSIGPQDNRQMDGNEDAVQPGDIISEYERRGRTRGRNSRPRYFHERETIYEKPDGEWIVRPGYSHGKVDDRPREGAWVSGGRPLHRALSESPSREELISPSRHRRSDGRGPYREQEKVTDSMRVEDGSRATVRGSMHGSIGEAAQVRW